MVRNMTLLKRCFPAVFFAAAYLFFGGSLVHAQEDVAERLERIDRDLKALQRQIYRQGVESTGQDGGTAASNRPAAGGQVARRQAKSLEVESLLQDLTGQVEELQFQVRQLRAQFQRLSDDANLRLARLEQEVGLDPMATGPSQTSRSGQSGPASAAGRQTAQQQNQQQSGGGLAPGQGVFGRLAVDSEGNPIDAEDLPQRARSDNAGAQSGSTISQPTDLPPPQVANAPSPPPVSRGRLQSGGSSEPVALPAGTPGDQYGYALGLLRQRDYERAEKALSLFLEAHPDDELAGNAQYWLGETYYVRDDYEQAAVNFLRGYRTYPGSAKAPDNLLKLGMTLARLDRTEQACQTFQQLSTEFPGANQSILRQLQQEQARLSCN